METYYVRVNVTWVQSVEAESKEEAKDKTVEIFQEEHNFTPADSEMTILTEEEVESAEK